MYNLDDFGLDVNERGELVCPPCDGAALREAGPVHILALTSIHRQEILLMIDDALCASLRQALDTIAVEAVPDQAPPTRLRVLK